jgi:hypothetical protein
VRARGAKFAVDRVRREHVRDELWRSPPGEGENAGSFASRVHWFGAVKDAALDSDASLRRTELFSFREITWRAGGTQGLKPASFVGLLRHGLKPCPFTFRVRPKQGRACTRLPIATLEFLFGRYSTAPRETRAQWGLRY